MTISLRLSETIIDAAIDKLNQGIADRIGRINSEKSDGIIVEPPNPGDIHPFGAPGGIIARAPAYVVTPFGESPVYEKEGSHGFLYGEQLAVMIVEEDPDRERVGRKLLRQQRAIIECLWDDQPLEALTDSAFTLQPVRHIPGPTFEPTTEVSAYRAIFIQVFHVRQQEGY